MSHISDAEWVFLELLWEHGELTITQMERLLKDRQGWSKHAIISFLKKMESKGLVMYRVNGKAKVFYTVQKPEDVKRKETEGFLNKVFHGRVGLMLSALVDEDCLENEEIDELMQILEEKRKER